MLICKINHQVYNTVIEIAIILIQKLGLMFANSNTVAIFHVMPARNIDT